MYEGKLGTVYTCAVNTSCFILAMRQLFKTSKSMSVLHTSAIYSSDERNKTMTSRHIFDNNYECIIILFAFEIRESIYNLICMHIKC